MKHQDLPSIRSSGRDLLGLGHFRGSLENGDEG